MKKSQKIISVILSFLFMANMISCSEKPTNDTKADNPRTFTTENIGTKAYKRNKIEIAENLNAIYCLEPYENGQKFFILGGTPEKTPVFYTADKNLQNFSAVEIPDFPIGTSYDIDVTEDGNMVEAVVDVDYGDLPEPDIYAEDYDAELYENTAEYGIFINTFSVDGQLLSSFELTDIYDIVPPETAMISELICTADGKYCILKINNIPYIISDGMFKGQLNSDKTIRQFGRNSGGDIICGIDYGDDNMKIHKINMQTGEFENSDVTYNFADTITDNFIPANDDYILYITGRKAVYGIKQDNSIEAVFDITSSELNANDIAGFFFDSENKINVVRNDYSKMKVNLFRFTECDPSEIENIPIVTVGVTYDNMFLNEFIADFNDNQSDFKIQVKDYSEYSTESNWLGAEEKLALDMVSENSPDIIIANLKNYDLAEKGAYADLYEFMPKDTLVPHIAELFETDGRMFTLPNSVYISCKMAKTSLVGDKTDWSAADYINLFENLPDDVGFEHFETVKSTMTKFMVFGYLMDYEDFISADGKNCSFDSDLFIRLLEITEPYPVDMEYNYRDISESSPEEMAEWSNNYDMQYINDKAVIYNSGFGDYSSYFATKKGNFGNAEITHIEKPYISFSETYSISAKSKNKDFAWEFLKEFFSDEFFRNDDYATLRFGFPVTKSAFEIYQQKAKEPQKYYDDDYTGYYFLYNNEPVKLGLPDDELIEEVNEIIMNSEKMFDCPPKVYDIVYEETDKFFNGDCTAQECADIIQNRVSIYLAEQQ